MRGGKLRLDLAERDKRFAARRPVKLSRGRGIQVVRERVPHPQRFREGAWRIDTACLTAVTTHTDHLPGKRRASLPLMGRACCLRAFSLANEFENANTNSRSFSNDLELLAIQCGECDA